MINYVKEVLSEENPNALFMDGFEDAVIGIGRQHSKPSLVVYDRQKCIEILAKEMTHEEAEDFFSFNCECAWMGEHTPLILDRGFEQ